MIVLFRALKDCPSYGSGRFHFSICRFLLPIVDDFKADFKPFASAIVTDPSEEIRKNWVENLVVAGNRHDTADA